MYNYHKFYIIGSYVHTHTICTHDLLLLFIDIVSKLTDPGFNYFDLLHVGRSLLMWQEIRCGVALTYCLRARIIINISHESLVTYIF